MARRALNIATVVSAVLLAVTAGLFVAGYVINPWDNQLPLANSCYVGVWAQGFDSRLVLFNDTEYGPYRGSIIGLVGDGGDYHPPPELRRAWGDRWGIYYRDFNWADRELWTLMVSLWYPLVLLAILPAAWLVRKIRPRRPKYRE